MAEQFDQQQSESEDAWKLFYPIPKYFTDPDRFPEGIFVSTAFTGLPLENDAMRGFLRKKFTETVRSGEGWAFLYLDADNLKTANDTPGLGREVGNLLLRWMVSQAATTLDKTQFSEGAEIIAVRHGGDEYVFWFLNLKNEDIEKIHALLPAVEKPRNLNFIKFDFSCTAYAISSRDWAPKDFRILMQKTKRWLAKNPENRADNLFNRVYKLADKSTKEKKTVKNQKKLDQEDWLQSIWHLPLKEHMQLIDDMPLKGRVDRDELHILVQLLAIKAKIKDMYPEELLEHGVSPNELEKMDSAAKIDRVRQRLFERPRVKNNSSAANQIFA